MNWYINKAAEKNLKEYQYDGADLSILYKLALSPFAQFLVDHFVPSWMAPNLITLIGLLIQLVTFGIVTAYCPLFCGDNETPRWVYVLIAASLFAYQTLDNMDGKQARKTGSSTPLGMIFDHSCDAINAIIGACMACTLFCVPSSNLLAVLMAISTTSVPFYFATWEEYYVHKLILQPFNGPSEGVFIGVMASLWTAIQGPFWWHQTLYSVPYYMLPSGFAVIAWIVTILYQTWTVCSFVTSRGKTVWKPLRDLIPFGYLLFFGISWICHTPHLLEQYPQAVVCCLFLLLAESEVSLMVCHVAGITYSPWRPILFPLAALWANSILLSKPLVDEKLLLFFYLGFALTYFALMLFKIIIEVRDSLGIYVFTLRSRPQKSMTLNLMGDDKSKTN